MKLANFLASKRHEVKRFYKYVAVTFATVCAFRTLRNDAPFGRTIFYCLLLAIIVYIILFCLDRAIGIMSPIVIDLNEVKDVSVRLDGYFLCIENSTFLIKAPCGPGGKIDTFQLFEKAEGGKIKLESNYISWTGENCLLLDDRYEYKLDGGLAKHLLAALNCHAEANHACRGLSFLA